MTRLLPPILLILLLGCPMDEPEGPPLWWTGAGAGAVAPDDDDAMDDDDVTDDDDFGGADIAVVGLDAGATMRLVGYEDVLAENEVVLEEVGLETRLQASGNMFFAMTGGAQAQIVVGSFNPTYSSVSNPLPSYSDPAYFVLGKACSVLVMRGSGSALVVPDAPDSMPGFADFSAYADADGDPDALSGLREGLRLFVGLARLGEDGPAPEGGLAVELDCEANVLETQSLGPGARLASGAAQATLGAVLVADGTVHGFAADSGTWQTAPLWEGDAVERLAVSDAGALWGVSGSRLLCKVEGQDAVEVADDLQPTVDMAVSASGSACVLSADALRCWPAKGCATKPERTIVLDAPGLELAVVTLTG